MLLHAGMDFDVIAGCFQPVDLRDANEIHSLLGVNRHALTGAPFGSDRLQQGEDSRAVTTAVLRQLAQGVIHCPSEPASGERFEQVVDGVKLEGTQRKRIVRRDENHGWGSLRVELLQYGK